MSKNARIFKKYAKITKIYSISANATQIFLKKTSDSAQKTHDPLFKQHLDDTDVIRRNYEEVRRGVFMLSHTAHELQNFKNKPRKSQLFR